MKHRKHLQIWEVGIYVIKLSNFAFVTAWSVRSDEIFAHEIKISSFIARKMATLLNV